MGGTRIGAGGLQSRMSGTWGARIGAGGARPDPELGACRRIGVGLDRWAQGLVGGMRNRLRPPGPDTKSPGPRHRARHRDHRPPSPDTDPHTESTGAPHRERWARHRAPGPDTKRVPGPKERRSDTKSAGPRHRAPTRRALEDRRAPTPPERWGPTLRPWAPT